MPLLPRANRAEGRATFERHRGRSCLSRSFAGWRVGVLGRRGRLLDDFALSATERALHVRNARLLAATSSPAIARRVADEA